MSAVWAQVEAAVRRSGGAMMVTVVGVRGSAPREAGARLIVDAAGGFTGTIGGGALEWRALARAQQELLARRGERLSVQRVALGPELGQCCGGDVSLAYQRFSAGDLQEIAGFAAREKAASFAVVTTMSADGDVTRGIATPSDAARLEAASYLNGRLAERFGEEARDVLLFGAGHVGRALVLALAPLPFRVTWVDPRPDAFPTLVPQNVTAVQADDPVAAVAAAAAGTFVLVMTHSHALDLVLVRAALGAGRFPYVGVIGSATKRARFARQLRDSGIAPAAIDSLICPIGMVGIRSKLPAVIAAGTVAELLVRDETLRAAATAPAARLAAAVG